MLLRTSRSLASSPGILCRHVAKTSSTAALRRTYFRNRLSPTPLRPRIPLANTLPNQTFHSSPASRKGISPESEEPTPPNPESHHGGDGSPHVLAATSLTDTEYHEYSEHYLNVLLGELERAQEEGTEIEAEYSVGVYFNHQT
jgi:frataxin